jgi:para-aminobenzoate synthetase component 1
MSLPSAIFRNDETGRQLVFDRPREIIVARSADEFAPALEAAQAASDAGWWLAGYLSYEAGYLRCPGLLVRRGLCRPLRAASRPHPQGRLLPG